MLSNIDPDAFGIVSRNLIENALKHGSPDTPINIKLSVDGRLTVTNSSKPISADKLASLALRFERGDDSTDGSGLGLSIVRTIAEGIGGSLILHSPIQGQNCGFEASVQFPLGSDSDS